MLYGRRINIRLRSTIRVRQLQVQQHIGIIIIRLKLFQDIQAQFITIQMKLVRHQSATVV